ncbi:DUF2125 domain-containing protein [Paracoccus stylophorae]|uniref:DUF2125 domain-containing protein n=1 Tax=Paracoccus stylophorae TaxID=659350 RepID=A0ABY7SV24_9RHOB|nr:DUF2125 domain-containing protein [Paracoccus stylophorae]WCR10783.1 DUF2125 domain-containing protein [Paracoccus stylophorae]
MFRTVATSAAALIAAASPVLADVTPAQVWDNISKYYTDMGYQVTTGSRDEAGDTLTLSDVEISADTDSSDVSITVPSMVLQQTGDQKVRTVIEGEITADMTSQMPEQDDATAHIVIAIPQNEMISAGSPGDILHQVVYPELLLSARFNGGQTADGTDGATGDMPVQVRMTDVAGSYRSVDGAGARSTYDMTAADLDLKLDLKDISPDEDSGETGSVTAHTIVDGLTITGSMVAPDGPFDMTENLHGALNAGLVIDGSFAMGPMTGSAEFSSTDADGAETSGNASFSNESSKLTMALSRDALTYRGSAKGSMAEMNLADLPFPISYAVDSATGGLSFPVSKADGPQPFTLSYALAGLTLADGIWDLFDPEGQLPRDPASLTVDLEGTATVAEDLLDPAMAERMDRAAQADGEAEDAEGDGSGQQDETSGDPAMPPMPFRPETITINQLTLQAVGATVDVTGDLTLPQDADQPVGTVQGSFQGVNTLLDTLVAMGVVPQEQMMGARMMLAMFARPSEDDPATLVSELEFRPDGSILANGQQVK